MPLEKIFDFGELKSNLKIGDAKAFNFLSSPNPKKSEGFGDLKEILSKIRAPSDAHIIIDSMEYSCPEPYKIRSAKTTLESGKGNCVECTLGAGLLMEQLGFPFRTAAMVLESKFHVAQSFYLYYTEQGYFSITKSRIPGFVSRDRPFSTIEGIVESYIPCINQEGFELTMSSELDESFFPFDWRYSDDCLDNLEKYLRKILCKKYREHLQISASKNL